MNAENLTINFKKTEKTTMKKDIITKTGETTNVNGLMPISVVVAVLVTSVFGVTQQLFFCVSAGCSSSIWNSIVANNRSRDANSVPPKAKAAVVEVVERL